MTRPEVTGPRRGRPQASSRAQAALRALILQGQRGSVSQLSRETGFSRQQIYDLRQEAMDAVTAAFQATESLEARGSFVLEVGEADIRRTVIALRAATPSSIRDEVALLPIIYGTGWSFGKIQGVLAEAERRAAAFLSEVDLSGIQHTAMDEMFSQGQPVLSGICLDTNYLFMTEVCPSRTGAEWGEILSTLRDAQKLKPRVVVKDAGQGMAKGITGVWPTIEQRDDLFHVVHALSQEAAHLERRAYATIAAVDELECARRKAKDETKRRSLGQQIRRAREHMKTTITRYDTFERTRREVLAVLNLVDRGSGRLRTSAEVQEALPRIAAEIAPLGGHRIRKVASYLKGRAKGLGRYLTALKGRLDAVAEAAGGVDVVEATTRAYHASLDIARGGPAWDRRAREAELADATEALLLATQRNPDRLHAAVAAVLPILSTRHRASSAIENLNSVLRPYLVVQKCANQGFLDLFRFYWNMRAQEWGRHKGKSAYELLTGKKVNDWLTLLGYPPSRSPSDA